MNLYTKAITIICSFAIANKCRALKQDGVHFFLCPKQGDEIEGVVSKQGKLCILGFFCLKQGQGFKPLAAHLYPNIGRVFPGNFVSMCYQFT